MKVALYARVSKSDGSQDIERQVEQLREFCQSKEWQIVEEVSEHVSGRRKKREGTSKLINLARSNQIQKVVVHEVSRLGRNLADTFNTVEALTEAKVSVYDLQMRQETLDGNYVRTAFANMILPVLAGAAQQWIQDHSYRIKSGQKKAIKEGRYPGRPKSSKIKNEDVILYLLKRGSSIRVTAQKAEVWPETVRKVKKKYEAELTES